MSENWTDIMIAEQWPEDEFRYIVNFAPLVIASVELTGLVGLRLHVWTPNNEIPPSDLIEAMALKFSRQVEEYDELPENWDYVQNLNAIPPKFLVCDFEDIMTGVLDIEQKKLFTVLEDNTFAEETPIEVMEYYQEFCDREDDLNEADEL